MLRIASRDLLRTLLSQFRCELSEAGGGVEGLALVMPDTGER